MRISAEWLDHAPNAAAEEGATLCRLSILLGEINVTEHLEAGAPEVFEHLIMPAYSLAEGLAREWWTLFGARDFEWRLMGHRMGYAVPDLRFRFDGAAFEAWAPNCAFDNPPVRFWSSSLPEVMTRQEAEAVLEQFIQATTDRLKSEGLVDTGAQLRWSSIQESRADPDEAVFCEAAGALRLDPYDIDDGSALLIQQAMELFKGEALNEFLGGVGRARAQETLEWIDAAERRPPYKSRLPDLQGVGEAAAEDAPAHEHEASWSLGYRRARAFRRRLDLKQGDRLRSFRELAERLNTRTFALADPIDGLRALRVDKADAVHVHLRHQGERLQARSAHNFAFARAVGDAVCFPVTRGIAADEPARAAINELRDAHRQSAGRAFAAELLAPIDEVRCMVEDGRDAVTIASEFGVATEVIERQVENEERIHAACAPQSA